MSREKILGRVREALKSQTDSHVRHASQQSSHALPVLANGPDGRVQAVREFLPPVGESYAEKVAAFASLSEKLQTQFVRVENHEAAKLELTRIAIKHRWQNVGIHEHELIKSSTENLDVAFLNTSTSYDVRDLERCDAGISGCDALIAQTASVLVTSQSAGGRALSVLPPHHVVLATSDQLVTTMADGYAILRQTYASAWPSFLSLITGPSRTADIERVLVLGAHGPKKLTVILIGDAPTS